MKFHHSAWWSAAAAAALAMTSSNNGVDAAGNVCMMLFQMADNNLEYFIRNDNYELTQSSLVRTPSLNTWIYFDNRNYGSGEDIFEPLENVYQSNGNPVTGTKIEGSQYLTWNHNLGKMVIDRTLQGEQNGDDPDTIYEFVVRAMTDCVSKGSDEFMVFFSSHGGGFYGFGGDDSPDRQRKLTQVNANIVVALTGALNDVQGAPAQYDVIGFDACLMQALGAADEYHRITKYYLASEAVEPGHGWAYDVLTSNFDNALDIAVDIQSNFLSQKQGWFHQTPKTLSVIDSSKYATFLAAWDTFFAAVENLMTGSQKDGELMTQISRARSAALAYEGVDGEVKKPSCVDIGDFMRLFQEGCNPGGNLETLLGNTVSAYNDMFVVRGVGEGTSEATTGMHVLWPTKQAYYGSKSFFDAVLFNNALYATTDAAEWLSFLEVYYDTSSTSTSSSTVCGGGSGVGGGGSGGNGETPVDPNRLLLDPELFDITNGQHKISTGIASRVDSVFIEFGIDLSPLLEDRRQLETSSAATNTKNDSTRPANWASRVADAGPKRLSHLRNKIATAEDPKQFTSKKHTHDLHRVNAQPHYHKQRRRSLQSDEYFIVFGGDVSGEYNQDKFDASWDRNFYLIEDSNENFDQIYVFDNGGGSKDIPVIYFSETVTSEQVYDLVSEDEAIEKLGGELGFLSFSANGTASTDGVVLFTYDGTVYSETPRASGGQFAPIVYVEESTSDVGAYIGGFFGTVISWDETNTISIIPEPAEATLDVFEVDWLTIDMLAYDDDALLDAAADSADGVDIALFFIDSDGIAYCSFGCTDDDNGTGGDSAASSLIPSLLAWMMSAAYLAF